MAYTVDTLVKVASAGGSLVVGDNYLVDSLVRIAGAMKGKGGRLTICNTGLLADSMIRIVAAAPGQVTFNVV